MNTDTIHTIHSTNGINANQPARPNPAASLLPLAFPTDSVHTVPITWEHQTTIERLRKDYKHELSSHAFASLHLWQQQMGLSLYLQEDFFTIKSVLFGENTWFFPCGNQEAIARFLERQTGNPSFSMVYLRECDVDWLQHRFPGRWEFLRSEESDEYICDIGEFVALRGSKFAEIRRNLRRIDAAYQVSFQPITADTLDDALTVVSEWFNHKRNTPYPDNPYTTPPHHITRSDSDSDITDDDVPENALRNQERLAISGSILYLDQKPVAVFAGFPLTDDTVDVLIGKCVQDAPRGTAYYALKGYLLSVQDQFTYCNHEEDLGIPGIRRMKNSLSPIRKNILWKAVQQ